MEVVPLIYSAAAGDLPPDYPLGEITFMTLMTEVSSYLHTVDRCRESYLRMDSRGADVGKMFNSIIARMDRMDRMDEMDEMDAMSGKMKSAFKGKERRDAVRVKKEETGGGAGGENGTTKKKKKKRERREKREKGGKEETVLRTRPAMER